MHVQDVGQVFRVMDVAPNNVLICPGTALPSKGNHSYQFTNSDTDLIHSVDLQHIIDCKLTEG